MSNRANITAEQVRAMLDYNPDTGEFRWRYRTPDTFPDGMSKRIISTWNARFAGTVAGTVGTGGRILIAIHKKKCFAHRLAILITLGRWPLHEVDHINGDPADNRLCNLREAIHAENMQNLKMRSTNTSGYTGVSLHVKSGRWKARITVSSKMKNIGYFDTKEDAYAAYLREKARLHTFQPTPRGEPNEQAA